MKVLLIFETIPDNIAFYVIENPSLEDITVLKTANGRYMNHENSKEIDIALEKISIAISGEIENENEYSLIDNEDFKSWSTKWSNSKIDVAELPNTSVMAVFSCGFIG